MVRIAIDAMGTENGLSPIVDGLHNALESRTFKTILVGDEGIIKSSLDNHPIKSYLNHIEILHTTDSIGMSDQASSANKRKDSSIFKSIELLKNNLSDSCLSAGHSGATMSIATLQIGRISGVSRPAICTCMPTTENNPSIILDVGANTDCKPIYLVDFAIMGYHYCRLMLDIKNPRVGLLANGEEDSKGNELGKETFILLKKYPFFKGNVEGNDIFNGSTDVIVCDGFSGNLVLKSSEGVASSIGKIFKSEVQKSIFRKLGALTMLGIFKEIKRKVDYAEYGGAPLLGIKKPVIISHGKSNSRAIECAIYQSIKIISLDVYNRMIEVFEKEIDSRNKNGLQKNEH